MNIMITGGTGFVGRNLKEELVKNNDNKIFAPTHNELDILDTGAVRNYIKKNMVNIVIHGAVVNGDREFNDIIKMFFSIYQNIDLIDKFINFGSGAEFGKTRDLIKIEEKDIGKYIPKDDYGLSKLICTLSTQKNKKVVHLRLFGVFGKYENYRYKFISNTIVKKLLALPIRIKQNVLFDYLYIDDLFPVVDYFIKNTDCYGDFNITPNESVNLVELAQMVNSLSKNKSEIIVENPGNNFSYTGSNNKITELISDLVFTPHKRAIEILFNYYSSILAELDKHAIVEDNYFLKSKIRSSNDK